MRVRVLCVSARQSGASSLVWILRLYALHFAHFLPMQCSARGEAQRPHAATARRAARQALRLSPAPKHRS